jgi:hypothetical protein
MGQLERRGKALQRHLQSGGYTFLGRLDFLVIAFPEYLGPDRPSLWYGRQPRVITVEELLEIAETPEASQGPLTSRGQPA